VELNLLNATAVRQAWKRIQSNVNKRSADASSARLTKELARGRGVRPRDFLGVTVQPMVQKEGYELILGSSLDPQFGPVLLFGGGGQLVEVLKDQALGLPPLNATLARRIIERTNIYEALKGVRGRAPVDLAALDQLLVRFSQLVVEQPWIVEIDINPLLASPSGLLALDARVVVHGPDMQAANLPKPAIRPYPDQYVNKMKLADGTPVVLRPIRPEDEPLLVKFHETLSERSVYFRYFSFLKLPQRIAHERLTRICFNDYDREIALVADHKHPKTGGHQILGVGRLSRVHGANDAEFALLVSDQSQNLGLGTALLKSLVHIGREEKMDRIIGHILPENRAMQQVSRKAGFGLQHASDEDEWKAVIEF
jgi:acetyltransferase